MDGINEAREVSLVGQMALISTARSLAHRAGAAGRAGLPLLRRAGRWLGRGLIALIYAPAVALLLIGAAAAVGLFGGLWRLVRALAARAIDTVPVTYDRLALAGHVAVVGGAFLALLCALVILAVGCRGRRWWRLYLIPGVPLSAATALFFLFAVQWAMLAVNQRLGWPPSMWNALTALALVDAMLVAGRIGGIGAGPLGTRRARLRQRLRNRWAAGRAGGHADSRQTRPIPIVRFGPHETGVPAPEASREASAAAIAGDAGVPTAEELAAAGAGAALAGEPPNAISSIGVPESGAA